MWRLQTQDTRPKGFLHFFFLTVSVVAKNLRCVHLHVVAVLIFLILSHDDEWLVFLKLLRLLVGVFFCYILSYFQDSVKDASTLWDTWPPSDHLSVASLSFSTRKWSSFLNSTPGWNIFQRLVRSEHHKSVVDFSEPFSPKRPLQPLSSSSLTPTWTATSKAVIPAVVVVTALSRRLSHYFLVSWRRKLTAGGCLESISRLLWLRLCFSFYSSSFHLPSNVLCYISD